MPVLGAGTRRQTPSCCPGGICPSPHPSPSTSPPPTPSPTPTPQTVSVDMRQYMAATIANAGGTGGSMLCEDSNSNICITSFYDGNQDGEVKIIYSPSSIVDYVGITYDKANPFGEGALNYIGVIRNLSMAGGTLRCFSAPNTWCTAPQATVNIIEGVPYLITALPVISYAAEQATENPDGSPSAPIPGALIATPCSPCSPQPQNYWAFAQNDFSNASQCAQSAAFTAYTQDRVVYVTQSTSRRYHSEGTSGLRTQSYLTHGPGIPLLTSLTRSATTMSKATAE